jgi:hypothetical protein
MKEELLLHHEKMGHIPFKLIQHAATQGLLPKRPSKCKIPICPSCFYGRLSRKPWRTSKATSPISTTNIPGAFVSVDQMKSTIPGLIAQMKGIPTTQRYKVAIVVIDYATDYTFIYFQIDTSADEKLRAKLEFGRMARSYGINIQHYHSDNGLFVDTKWRQDALQKSQRVSMCGVNAHHQNGKVERQIRNLQDLAWSSLMQAIKCWPDAINIFLLPYAVCKAVEDLNHIPRNKLDA